MKARASDNIPVLTDILIPGSVAARGQAATATKSPKIPEPQQRNPTTTPAPKAAVAPTAAAVKADERHQASEADVESLVDAILAKHLQQIRRELVQEIKALLKENYYIP